MGELSVIGGPGFGTRVRVSPGQRVTVGRGRGCTVSIPGDRGLMEEHLSIIGRADGASLEDLSGKGVTVGGRKVAEWDLASTDLISASASVLHFRALDPKVPETDSPAPAPVSAEPTQEKLAALNLLERLGHVHALVDAARSPLVLPLLQKSDCGFWSLYQGDTAESLQAFAPYLVALPPGTALLSTLVREGWADAWGIYLVSSETQDVLRNHLRKFLIVRAPDGKEMYFRFYDPRVLRVFLPACTPDELAEFFGPIREFVIEGDDGMPLVMQVVDRRLMARRVDA